MAFSLVSYDSSEDSSEEESDCRNRNNIGEVVGQKIIPCTELKLENENEQTSKSSMVHSKTYQSDGKIETGVDSFTSLPKAKFHDTDIDWNYLKILKGSQCGTVKISVPSLAEVEDNNMLEPDKKKLKPSQKGSGLFALLPSPKKQNKLIPQVASSKKNVNSYYMSNNSYKNMDSKESVCPVSDCVESEECNFDQDNDFFSLSKSENNDIHITKTPGDNSVNTTGLLQNPYEDKDISNVQTHDSLMTENFQQKSSYLGAVHDMESSQPVATASFISTTDTDIELNDVALQQLCGKRDRHKLKAENVELIEICGDSIMPDTREWLTKQLTEENQYVAAQSHKKKDGPTSQQKRKHQITYLAFQAKEHELELKNQWASNRMSRKQTQAKYGF